MTYTINYSGAWLSLNAVYSTHFHLRNKEKNKWKGIFTQMLTDAQIPALTAFTLAIAYNSRCDCDNLTGGSKVFVDTMRALNIVPDDTKYYYRGITITPDLALKHNTYCITITEVPAAEKITPAVKRKKVE